MVKYKLKMRKVHNLNRHNKGMHPTPRIAVCRFNNFIIDCLHNFMRR